MLRQKLELKVAQGQLAGTSHQTHTNTKPTQFKTKLTHCSKKMLNQGRSEMARQK